MMNNSVAHFTHNDLDALGCMLNVHFALPNTQIEVFHTNYRNIDAKVDETINWVAKHMPSLLIVSDVSFAQYKHLLEDMINVCETTGTKLLYLDHHVYPDGFFDGLNINYSHDVEKAATLITHEYFGNAGKHSRLDALTKLINTYDIWLIQDAWFTDSLNLNEYFWDVDIDWLFNEIITNDYKLPSNYESMVTSHVKAAKESIEKYYNKGLIHSDGFTTIAFMDNYFNQLLMNEFNADKKILIIANSYGIIRLRFNQINSIPDDIKLKIKYEVCGTEDVGHLNAFALKVEHNSFEHIMTEIKRISSIINKHIKG